MHESFQHSLVLRTWKYGLLVAHVENFPVVVTHYFFSLYERMTSSYISESTLATSPWRVKVNG